MNASITGSSCLPTGLWAAALCCLRLVIYLGINTSTVWQLTWRFSPQIFCSSWLHFVKLKTCPTVFPPLSWWWGETWWWSLYQRGWLFTLWSHRVCGLKLCSNNYKLGQKEAELVAICSQIAFYFWFSDQNNWHHCKGRLLFTQKPFLLFILALLPQL